MVFFNYFLLLCLLVKLDKLGNYICWNNRVNYNLILCEKECYLLDINNFVVLVGIS